MSNNLLILPSKKVTKDKEIKPEEKKEEGIKEKEISKDEKEIQTLTQ